MHDTPIPFPVLTITAVITPWNEGRCHAVVRTYDGINSVPRESGSFGREWTTEAVVREVAAWIEHALWYATDGV